MIFFFHIQARSDTTEPYNAIQEKMEEASNIEGLKEREIIYFTYGNERIPIRQSSFESYVRKILKTRTEELEKLCADCAFEKSEMAWVQRLIHLTKVKSIEISAFAYKGFKQHGLPYALFFVIFESTEHTIFAWLPPLCPVYHAAYFAVSNFLTKFKLLFARGTEMKISQRATVIAKSIYLDIFFWHRLRHLSVKDSDEKQDEDGTREDLDFIFSNAPSVSRYWVAKKHMESYALFLEFLGDYAATQYGKKLLTTKDYFEINNILGRLGHILNNLMEGLRLFSFSEDSARLNTGKRIILQNMNQIRGVLEQIETLHDLNREQIPSHIRNIRESCMGLLHNMNQPGL